jgi:hypothetical protein
LYVVGGSVRDFLAGLLAREHDWDICSPLSADEFVSCANACGFTVKAVYRNTGTVKLHDSDGVDYEYSCFRSDKYVRGTHVPVEIFFTEDICLDARRRDFTVNAIYYDIAKDEWETPVLIEDCQSRSDFIVYGGQLYMFHAPIDREHIGIVKINTEDIAKSEIVLQAKMHTSCFYPFVQYFDGNELAMSYTADRQHIRLARFTLGKYL